MEGSKAQRVREFMEKHGAPMGVAAAWHSWHRLLLSDIAIKTMEASRTLQERHHNMRDAKAHRASLILEEVAELLDAMARGDEVDMLDALADIAYVVEGTAVTFGLPMDAAFEEVHRSNMTKHACRENALNKTGDRGRGLEYVAPRLADVLAAYRALPQGGDVFMDGDAWLAIGANFINLQESITGAGMTPSAAVTDLLERQAQHMTSNESQE